MPDTWIFVLKIIGVVIVTYFLGNINFSDIYSHARHVDIHKEGSGNPGTMNMLRTFGMKVAMATLVCDALKGIVSALLGYFILQIGASFGTTILADPSPFLGYYVSGVGKLGMIIGGLSAVIGHIVPVVNKFHGGKGVATALGVFLAMNPFIALGTFMLGLIYLTIHKYGCVSSFICILSSAAVEIALACVYGDNVVEIILVAVLAVLVVAVHWPNLISLAKGTERDSNLIRRFKKSKAKKLAAAQAEQGRDAEEAVAALETVQNDGDGSLNTQDQQVKE